MEISSSLDHTIDGMRMLGDVVTSLSAAGAAGIILAWSRMLGIHNDVDFSAFRRPMFLMVPLAAFILAVLLGYFLGSVLTGFFFELTDGVRGDGTAIGTSEDYFIAEFPKFNAIGLMQLVACLIGILTLSGWFLWNIRHKVRSVSPQ